MIFCNALAAPESDRKYRGLSPKTRLLIGGGIMAYAVLGLLVSDEAEKKFGMVPTEEDKKELKSWVPKVTMVDRNEKS